MKKMVFLAGIVSAGLMFAPLGFAGDLLGTVQGGLDKTQQGMDTLKQGQQLLGSGEEAKEAVTGEVQEQVEAGQAGQELLTNPDVATDAAKEAAKQKATDTASDAAATGVKKLWGD